MSAEEGGRSPERIRARGRCRRGTAGWGFGDFDLKSEGRLDLAGEKITQLPLTVSRRSSGLRAGVVIFVDCFTPRRVVLSRRFLSSGLIIIWA
ncbi:hypothetical protein QQ045_022560 [Rhodiola kirilowii]